MKLSFFNLFLLITLIRSIFFSSFLFGDTLNISGNPSVFNFTSTIAGQQPATLSNNSTTYTLTVLGAPRTILGNIDATKTGVTLKVSLASPALGAFSNGLVVLSTINQTLVGNIPLITISLANTVTYNIDVTMAAAKGTSTFTMTLTVQ